MVISPWLTESKHDFEPSNLWLQPRNVGQFREGLFWIVKNAHEPSQNFEEKRNPGNGDALCVCVLMNQFLLTDFGEDEHQTLEMTGNGS